MRIAYNTLYEINAFEKYISPLTDEQLKAKTQEFKDRLNKGELLEDIRSEAFAVSREATKRVLGKRPFDVQMIGGVILDLGSVAEMKTGEGKTITSIAPVYLNALTGENVIVSTVNEYLAERDAEEMGQVFNWLGLSVGVNKAQMATNLKREAYNCDITYSIHSELGFDYLRDNMVMSKEEKVQRGLNFILLDEVDSILIDEAKTPLIISGGDGFDSNLYSTADLFVRTLDEEDYYIDEESKSVYLTDEGISKANIYFGFSNLYNIENSELVHRIQNALRAHKVMKLDVEYIVLEDKIELVDSFTGRVMEGRAYSEGLQQAIQAKERIEIESETKTLATITYQNFFRLFKKLSGMTGTAKTEEKEFIDIYNMRVNVVPTNKPIKRFDDLDEIYVDTHSKYMAIVKEVKHVYETRKQPILIGTAQVEDSERLHEYLFKANIPHTVLNAKQNAEEANIIARAGQLGAITIATNMAGRGTDIKPSEEAKKAGGLYVLGTDKAESRRIDNQLKGRSGRQGDVGYTKFFLSLDDQLILRFSVQDQWKEMFKDSGNAPIKGNTIRKAFLRAQKKIEGFNYDNRKSVLNYDDVIRQQRDLIYQQRDWILEREDLGEIINKMIISATKQIVNNDYFTLKNNTLDYVKFIKYLNESWLTITDYRFTIEEVSKFDKVELIEYISKVFIDEYEKLREIFIDKYGVSSLVISERRIILSVFDAAWQDHINTMDKLRQSSNLVQYSQKNPYQVYTQEGSKRFAELTDRIATESVVNLLNNPECVKTTQQTNSEMTQEDIEELRNRKAMIDSMIIEQAEIVRNDGYDEDTILLILNKMKSTLYEQFGFTFTEDDLLKVIPNSNENNE
nr:preprotein translocase subunit SecA [Mycoplasma phocoenae]